MNYIIFEDENFISLSPFILTHPVFEVRCGAYTNFERIEQLIQPNDNLILLVREELEENTIIKYPAYEVNPEIIPEGIFLNSSCIWDTNLINQFSNGRSYTYKNKLVASCNEKEFSRSQIKDYFLNSLKVTKEIEVKYINYLWDSIFLSHDQIFIDFTELNPGKLGSIHPSAVLENDENIYLGQGSFISAGVILDASNGPIIISKDTIIEIGAMIQGPVFIGPRCIINPGAKLRGNTILGPVCKIGGEIEDCIIQGFSNKQHDGFLGHSYLGEWVNLGANTNNSNLKNNYSDIKIMVNNNLIDTHQKFIGVMMGDYSRSGISTMFNTGTYVGVGANIFGSDFQEKNIKSFQWGKSEITNFDKFIETCRIMKSRRKLELLKCEERLLRLLYDKQLLETESSGII